ncbi:MAG TPA: serine/threonine-protein kinase [Pyrinomonadaceae bacterium]|jgi:serine/threonine protein kinase
MKGLERYLGEVLDNKYRIEKLLGKGGMGAVYLSTHLGTERPVALKIIAPEFMRNDEFVERFKREARAAGRLRHPNVVDVTDFGFAEHGRERVAYLVMEYLDGCALSDVLAEETRLPLDWVVDILEQVCSAIDEAHQQGIVHRDLKPDNIWLEPNRRGGYTIKVLDFGVAKLAEETSSAGSGALSGERAQAQTVSTAIHSRAHMAGSSALSENATLIDSAEAKGEAQTRIFEKAGTPPDHQGHEPSAAEAPTQLQPSVNQSGEDNTLRMERETSPESVAVSTASVSSLTRIGSILGTPLYMSPEQCRGERLDARSDIYSLGVIAFQMLAGEPPFSGNLTTVMRLHKEEPPPPLRERNAKIPKRVALLVSSAMAKDPSERPANAGAFASALRGHTDGIGSLLRRSFALYSEYFPVFLQISVLAHVPLIILAALMLLSDFMNVRQLAPTPVLISVSVMLGLLSIIVNFLAHSFITGMTVLIAMQLIIAPLRPVRVRDTFAALKKRRRPFLSTSIRLSLRMLVGFIPLVVPGIVMIIRYALYAPVVLLEGLEKKEALKRARELMRRSRLTVIIVICLQVLIPAIIATIATHYAIGGIKDKNAMLPKLYTRLVALLNIFIIPLISIMSALLYLKMRQIGGEPLRDIADKLESDDRPRSKWQQRMRERLSLGTRTSRH